MLLIPIWNENFFGPLLCMPLIYVRLEICVENLLLLHTLVARLSYLNSSFVSLQLTCRRRVCFLSLPFERCQSLGHHLDILSPVVAL